MVDLDSAQVIVSCDPGLSGVISVRTLGSNKVQTFPAPFTLHKDIYARPVVDVEEWSHISESIRSAAVQPFLKPVFIMIEAPAIHGGMDSNIAVAGIHWYGGCLDAAFRLAPWESQIEYVRPQQWQKAIIHPFISACGYPFPKGGKGARAQWKQLSIEYVRVNYGPEVLKFSRGRKENDNIADSICISEYAAKILSGEIVFQRSWVYTPRKKWQNKYSKKETGK